MKCVCGETFCFKCLQADHSPVDCSYFAHFTLIGQKVLESEEASKEWLALNSKECPKCKRPIQKNDGCNHMTCSRCKHEFCWLCLWKIGNGPEDHVAKFGFGACSSYQQALQAGLVGKEVKDKALVNKNFIEVFAEKKCQEFINRGNDVNAQAKRLSTNLSLVYARGLGVQEGTFTFLEEYLVRLR